MNPSMMTPNYNQKANEAAPQLPAFLTALGLCLPAYPGSLLCVAALNLVLRPQLPDDVRNSLLGRHLRVRVSDAGVAFDFSWNGASFTARRNDGVPDLEIGACVADMVALARRQQDPDTLFFARRLTMEGDTELGLLVKNTLDAMEVPLTEAGKQAVLRLLKFLPRPNGGAVR